jgi:hypothetical protein
VCAKSKSEKLEDILTMPYADTPSPIRTKRLTDKFDAKQIKSRADTKLPRVCKLYIDKAEPILTRLRILVPEPIYDASMTLKALPILKRPYTDDMPLPEAHLYTDLTERLLPT